MNKIEFEQCVHVVAERVEAATNGAAAKLNVGDEQFAIFAGSGLPAREVVGFLQDQSREYAPLVADMPAWLVIKSVSLNAFLLGVECGRRSK